MRSFGVESSGRAACQRYRKILATVVGAVDRLGSDRRAEKCLVTKHYDVLNTGAVCMCRLTNTNRAHRAFPGADIRPRLGGSLNCFGADGPPAYIPPGIERKRASTRTTVQSSTLLYSEPPEELVLGGARDRLPCGGFRRYHFRELR